MKTLLPCLLLALLGTINVAAAEPATMIVKDGQPNAQIVIAAKNRPRMVTLAALDLQYYIQKISGARLQIVTVPNQNTPVKIYVGKSPETDRLGVSAEGLESGAYRMVSGPNWLVLLGDGYEFVPPFKPFPTKRNKSVKEAQAAWDKAIKGKTQTAWGFPFRSAWKRYWHPRDFDKIMTDRYGKDAAALWMTGGNKIKGFWSHDEAGSLNAVCKFLNGLGVRWFMPGEMGEVLPKMASIPLPKVNVTVKPDYPIRAWTWYLYSGHSYDNVLWAKRIGMDSGNEKFGGIRGPHGHVIVHRTEAMRKAHPEYYALLNGKRDVEHRKQGTACYTSEGLFKETVNYLRFMFDDLKLGAVDIWPGDGFRRCQCPNCKGKTPSELVWGFANRVATELYKTNPDNIITCGAYTSYNTAPDTIEKFSPNLAVWITNCGRPLMNDPEHWAQFLARLEKFREKMGPNRIMRTENNRYHLWGKRAPISYPIIHPRAVAKELKALKGISLGDTGEQSQIGGRWRAMPLEHITLYVQSRFLWDADQDVDQVLDDYFEKFYGPAAKQMKEAINFAELNIAYKDQSKSRGRADPRNVSLATALRLRELLDVAQKTAGDTIFGSRIQAISSSLQPKDELIAMYKERDEVLAKQRATAPLAFGVEGADLSKATTYKLKTNRGGRKTAVATTFRVGWDKNAILFDIVCKEPEMRSLSVSDDVYSGDNVVVSLATPMHSYYQLEITPDGTVKEGNPGSRWKSLASIKTERGADFWRVKLRIPVVGADEANADPNHRVAGSKPTARDPWYFNVGRHRAVSLKKPELQAFSPTGRGWGFPAKFGKLVIK